MRAGRRTQVAKGAVCKTAMQRFEPARRLQSIQFTESDSGCFYQAEASFSHVTGLVILTSDPSSGWKADLCRLQYIKK